MEIKCPLKYCNINMWTTDILLPTSIIGYQIPKKKCSQYI